MRNSYFSPWLPDAELITGEVAGWWKPQVFRTQREQKLRSRVGPPLKCHGDIIKKCFSSSSSSFLLLTAAHTLLRCPFPPPLLLLLHTSASF